MSSSFLTADVKLLFWLIIQRSVQLFSQAYIWAQSKPVSRFLGNVRGLQTFLITLQIRRLCYVLAQSQAAVFLISTQISFAGRGGIWHDFGGKKVLFFWSVIAVCKLNVSMNNSMDLNDYNSNANSALIQFNCAPLSKPPTTTTTTVLFCWEM